VDEYGLVQDSGGAGTQRGGMALVRRFRLTADEAILQVRSDRRRFRPWGLAGGQPGAPSSNVLNPEGEARPLPSKFTMTILKGDTLRHVQPGGGGYGDPFLREPARVLEDVLDEKVSLEAARREYGVAIDLAARRVDAAKTARLRAVRGGTR
jgi:N-methylhydantoinase B